MNSFRKTETEHRLPSWALPTTFLRLAGLVMALTLLTARSSYSYAWYSGASVGSDGTVYGWGVTDGTSYTMYHVAYVTTTLTSPVKHRQATLGQHSAQNMVREDVSLPFDDTDLGYYFVTSTHYAYCYAANYYFINGTQSGASANDAPARLIPADYPPCAPKGVGPLQVFNNQNVVNCAGTVIVTGFDGVNRNLMYQLVDGTGAAFVGAYNISESFSNFQKTPTNSGLTQPQAQSADIPAYGLVGDYQYAGYKYPTYLGSNEHSSYTQSFTVKVGLTVYPLTTKVSISLGNFNGTSEDNVTITTP